MVRLDITARYRYLITGLVQGVGFRPHVYRVACAMSLTGYVKNTASGVEIEVEGENVSGFLSECTAHLPPLARIDTIDQAEIAVLKIESSFEILASEFGLAKTIIVPDIATCEDCLAELFDQHSRYYDYPFLNCTNCGPRFSITKQLPYDRVQTSMGNFLLCDACELAYKNPKDRRYHAQPTACALCGPRLSHSVDEIVRSIQAGKIIAIKSVGGYQLVCDARNDNAVKQLRIRKERPAKPFSLMVKNSDCARHIVDVNGEELSLLDSVARPIVLLRKKKNALSTSIAPGLSTYGVMLPYSPLHHLLFNQLEKNAVLVVTSANVSGNPLIIDDDAAQSDLSTIADTIVSYNRDIVCRVDDSVMQVVNRQSFYIRRARGYVPTAISLLCEIPSTLALGAHLKNTFCITRGNEAFVSQYIGSLNNKATIEYLHETLAYFVRFLNVKPTCVVHDCHPDFYTTQMAQSLDLPTYAVLHHHAHLMSVAAEHHIQSPAIGLVLDGYGYGEDGGAWGGELFFIERTQQARLGHLEPIPLFGGERAVREPWRIAAGVLSMLGRTSEIADRFKQFSHAKQLMQWIDQKNHTVMTSSCGRLFDAASA